MNLDGPMVIRPFQPSDEPAVIDLWQMMVEAERLLAELKCPKINLQVRTTNQAVIEFYQRLGYSIDAVVSLGKRLEKDDPGGE